ncbi:hypothetical protein SASPL_127345 [Salvia splendens]|uniref:WRKY domain-containing protein n=1 Tax=Salvia splendens TaxID=180675 RepID=A0A8X8XBX6_SALSN|nr:probable WRKY transcription factor 29 [Salvia splendens]KAG6409308.1 hypothetical protein SASPL_127345 [Salvia splendens]
MWEVMEDWSLQAIVQGSSGEFGKMEMEAPDSFFQSDQDLGDIFKPFYPDQTNAAEDYTPKYKKRKNEHKRVVVKVSAEGGLSSDMWAWRKYGQKPIKGSPYPRSYYSSKGCLARKQVEQSCTETGMFIITYTAEHSHSQPTRRNSLAGTVRQKFPSPKPSHKSQHQTERDVKPVIKVEENPKPDPHEFVFSEDFFSWLEEFDEFAQPFSV